MDDYKAIVEKLEADRILCIDCKGVEIAKIYDNRDLESHVSSGSHVAVIGPGSDPVTLIDSLPSEQTNISFWEKKNKPRDTTVYDFMARLSEGHLTLIDVLDDFFKSISEHVSNNRYGIHNLHAVANFLEDLRERGAKFCDITYIGQNVLKRNAVRKISRKINRQGAHDNKILVDHRSWESIFPLMPLYDEEKWSKLAEIYLNICKRLKGNSKIYTYFGIPSTRTDPINDIRIASRAYSSLGARVTCYYNYRDIYHMKDTSTIKAIESGYKPESVYSEPESKIIKPWYPTNVLIVASL